MRIALADLEIGRIGDDRVELLLRAGSEKPLRAQHLGIFHDEVSNFDANHNPHPKACLAPVGQIGEHRPQHGDQSPVYFIGNQFNRIGFRDAGNRRLNGRAAKDTGTRRGIENANASSNARPSCRDPCGHEIRDRYRCEKKPEGPALTLGYLRGVPSASTIRKGGRPFSLARERRARARGSGLVSGIAASRGDFLTFNHRPFRYGIPLTLGLAGAGRSTAHTFVPSGSLHGDRARSTSL